MKKQFDPASGGVAMFQPDFVSETFEPGTETGGADGDGRSLRYLEWRWLPDSKAEMYVTDMAYLLRDGSGTVQVIHDRHLVGLFPRTLWLELIAAAGFGASAVPSSTACAAIPDKKSFSGCGPFESFILNAR